MDFNNLNNKFEFHVKNKHFLKRDPYLIKNFEQNFNVRYTHESTAIEGNSLTLFETNEVLINKRSIAGKDLRELYEVINHDRAFGYVKKSVKEGKTLSEEVVNSIHEKLMVHIMEGGKYRNVNVYITGATKDLPDFQLVPNLMKEFYQNYNEKSAICTMPDSSMNIIELACWIHARFIVIHPFRDGNGRTARLMLNFELIKNGYLPVSIPDGNRSEYYRSLDIYHSTGDLEPFIKMIADLEEKQLDVIISNEKIINREMER